MPPHPEKNPATPDGSGHPQADPSVGFGDMPMNSDESASAPPATDDGSGNLSIHRSPVIDLTEQRPPPPSAGRDIPRPQQKGAT